jgi:hypothetical protein
MINISKITSSKKWPIILNFNERGEVLEFVREYIKSKIYIINLEPIYIEIKTGTIKLIEPSKINVLKLFNESEYSNNIINYSVFEYGHEIKTYTSTTKFIKRDIRTLIKSCIANLRLKEEFLINWSISITITDQWILIIKIFYKSVKTY